MTFGWGLAVTAHFCCTWGGSTGAGPFISKTVYPHRYKLVLAVTWAFPQGFLTPGGWVPGEVVEVASLLGSAPKTWHSITPPMFV